MDVKNRCLYPKTYRYSHKATTETPETTVYLKTCPDTQRILDAQWVESEGKAWDALCSELVGDTIENLETRNDIKSIEEWENTK